MISVIAGIVIALMTGSTVIMYCCLCAASSEDEWMERCERQQYEAEVNAGVKIPKG